jgi:hypothetical protein
MTNSSWIYVSDMAIFEERIKQYAAALGALHERTTGSSVMRHDLLADGVARVTYANGVTVTVNYNRSPYTADGVTVEALSYTVEG